MLVGLFSQERKMPSLNLLRSNSSLRLLLLITNRGVVSKRSYVVNLLSHEMHCLRRRITAKPF